jgi:SAM-dependent methyltransferase
MMPREEDERMNGPRERPKDRAGWDERYEGGVLPWDTNTPDAHLRGVLEAHGISPGKALEVGCGTGTNAIWLARQGFDVTGLDLSQIAIDRARAKVAAAKVGCRILALDFLADEVPGAPYGFAYDRGCFHVFDGAQERSRFASRVADLLAQGGIWHSLVGSTDGPPRDSGPPRRSAADIVAAVEPRFEILELRSTLFDEERNNHARAWVLVARRRAV